MNLGKRMIVWAGVALIGGCGCAQIGGESTARADAITSAPQGLKVSQTFLNKPSTLGSTGVTNSAAYTEVAQSNQRLPMSVIQISSLGNHNAGGAVWSQTPTFDLYKNQKFSMWVYASGDIAGSPGEGLAFVLQNNNNNQFSGTGESLGVWGADPKSTTGGPDTIAGTAIQKSWALEFDTEANQTDPTEKWNASSGLLTSWNLADNEPSDFDSGEGTGYGNGDGHTPNESVKGEHISSGYPGEASTYEANTGEGKNGIAIFPREYYYYTQNHFGLIRDSTGSLIADQNWHHITLNYTAPSSGSTIGTMMYSYDDVNPQTGATVSSNKYVSESLDTSKLGTSSANGKVYWGITGSTGQSWNSDSSNDGTQNSDVVLEHIPGEADGAATAQLTDETSGAVVKSGDKINGGDKVKLTYTATQTSSGVDWKDINAQLHIPQGIKITSGTFSPQDGGTAQDLNMSDLTGTVSAGQTLNENIGTLSAQNKTAKITLTGYVQNDRAYSTTDTTSDFVGDGTMASATIEGFSTATIPLSMELDQSKYNFNHGQPVVVTGKVDGATANSNIKIRVSWIPEGSITQIGEGVTTLSDQNPASGFKLPVTKLSEQPAGNYTLRLYALDVGNGNLTGDLDVPVVIGTVGFGDSSGDLVYNAAISGGPQTVPRDDANWKFDINDTETAGTPWKLTARASALMSTTVPASKLDGELVYSNGVGEPVSLATDTVITDHQSDGSDQPVNIADGWQSDTGILLKLNGGAAVGDYKGTVTWELSNVP